VDEYNQDFYILLQDYYNHLTPYSKILEFDSRTDLHDLDYRLHLIAKSQEGVKAYKDLLNELETRYLQKIEALDLVELQHPTAKQKGRLWLSTINSTHQFFNQLMLHDVKTMEMQHVLLRFLYNRYASLSFTDQQIIFQTAKERDDYITLRTRIDKFSLSRPNFNQLSTRK
jgi:hypothetical protein